MISGVKFLIGANFLKIITKLNPIDNNDDKENRPKEFKSLKCSCQKEGLRCYKVLKKFTPPITNHNSKCSPVDVNSNQNISNQVYEYPDMSNTTFSSLVDKLGGICSSPQISFTHSRNGHYKIVVKVHKIFFFKKMEDINATVDFYPKMLCEDVSGEFAVFKFANVLENDEKWSILFGDDWMSLIGKTILVHSPFLIQGRFTKAQDCEIFSCIKSIKKTDQRFYYIFKCFFGSYFDLNMEDSEHISFKTISSTKTTMEDRNSIITKIFYCDTKESILYASGPSGGNTIVKIFMKKVFPLKRYIGDSQTPFDCTIVDVNICSNGEMYLDGYSAIINVSPSPQIDFQVFPPRTKKCQSGDLIKIEGVVTKINVQLSMQWLECSLCKSDELENTEIGWKCLNCEIMVTLERCELL